MLRNTLLISCLLGGAANIALVQSVVQAQSDREVARIAKAISVEIETSPQSDGSASLGSGVIVQKQGDLYTVLTAAHVVKSGSVAKIKTATDDRVHQLVSNSMRRSSGDIDLAIVQFRSDLNYPVAKIGDSNLLEPGMDIFVSGFPAPTLTITERVWVFREGKVTANSNKTFQGGYSLIYSNSTLPGMSGGAVLNKAGELVAIHGKGDRTKLNQKTDYNLGIPIGRFSELAKEIKGPTGTEIPVTPTASTPKADDFFISALGKTNANNSQAALADLDRAIAANPKFTQAYSSRGTLKYLRLNDPTGALADYNQAIAIDPRYAIAYNNRGNLKENKLNDLGGAMADYDRAISIDPRYAIAYYNRASMKQRRLKDFTGALADYDRSIAIDSHDAEAYQSRSNLKYLQLNDIQGALADLNQAIAIDPRYGEAYFNRGVLKKEKLNDREGAIQDFRQSAKLFRAQRRNNFLQYSLKQLQELGARE
jgi:tetratricopeptide (TPR) repeat protein